MSGLFGDYFVNGSLFHNDETMYDFSTSSVYGWRYEIMRRARWLSDFTFHPPDSIIDAVLHLLLWVDVEVWPTVGILSLDGLCFLSAKSIIQFLCHRHSPRSLTIRDFVHLFPLRFHEVRSNVLFPAALSSSLNQWSTRVQQIKNSKQAINPMFTRDSSIHISDLMHSVSPDYIKSHFKKAFVHFDVQFGFWGKTAVVRDNWLDWEGVNDNSVIDLRTETLNPIWANRCHYLECVDPLIGKWFPLLVRRQQGYGNALGPSIEELRFECSQMSSSFDSYWASRGVVSYVPKTPPMVEFRAAEVTSNCTHGEI